jgi:hypothetical protein
MRKRENERTDGVYGAFGEKIQTEQTIELGLAGRRKGRERERERERVICAREREAGEVV